MILKYNSSSQLLLLGLVYCSLLHCLFLAMAKCIPSGAGCGSTSSAKQWKTGIGPKWSTGFPWMLGVDNGQGMMCSLCCKHNWHPNKAALGRAIWLDLAYKSLMKQSLVKHSQSKSHSTAVKMEAALYSSSSDGGIALAFQ